MTIMQFLATWFSADTVRIVRFLISGGTAAATNLSILYVLTEFFGVWYLFSSVIAVSFAWVVSFTLQKFWTFENRSLERVHVQAPLHLTVSLASIVVNTAALFVFVEYLHVWYFTAQVVVGVLIAFVNYFVYKRYIFI